MPPTSATYTALQAAFDHFNVELFAARLPQCLITLRSSARTYGYLHTRRFVNMSGEPVDELGINPGYFAVQSPEEVMATVVHEMAHHWQHHFGTPSKSLPHNREWAAKMEELGLMPSHTGLPGGKRTGRSMSDYILPDGKFIRACAVLQAKNITLPWLDSHLPVTPEHLAANRNALIESKLAVVGGEPPIIAAQANGVTLALVMPKPRPAPSRVSFTCPQCHIRAWAAPTTALTCGSCDVRMENG